MRTILSVPILAVVVFESERLWHTGRRWPTPSR